ncbi:hypothetical protein FSOLCH5_009611 [Fusarium solani]|uniref:Serine-rich protein n=1 Tax=Fusarium solani TaxID=169388 RepID=A0A9P9KK51_FUSSL|nr:uncharacterized protein B0J15DRAFT_275587 [Fusarium solani]KAH7260036.1 hypothetical protein B0J15DRAFT_275587 [Fusarium solani]KAJ3463893.1 hypothetical protein MRS44_008679 [Fusarium solani]
MSVSPSCSPPRRALHERTDSENNRLQIRIVPYSPPRIASDGTTPRPVSYADASTETDPELSQICYDPLHSSSPLFETPSPSLQRGRTRKAALSPSPLSRHPQYPSSDIELSPSPWTPHNDADDETSDVSHPRSREPSTSPRPPSRRKVINVHADKTFSVHPQEASTSSRVDSFWSRSFTTGSSSFGRASFGRGSLGQFSEDRASRPSSPLTPLTERSSKSPIPSSPPQALASPDNSSPWNYRMFGGLRKVPTTPDVKQSQLQIPGPAPELPLPPLPEIEFSDPGVGPSSQLLNQKTSFQSTLSEQSRSTLSDRTNYKVYGQSSPVAVADLTSLPASSIHSNIELIGDPSSVDPSLHDNTRPPTRDSEANYVVHGHSASSSVVAVKTRVRPEYSQESLVVPPLRTRRRRSSDTFGLVKTRSRETLRTASLTSLSTIFTQEATRGLFVGPATILHHTGPSWYDPAAAKSPNINTPRSHQWSAQLSTVMSESEGGSEPASRALSLSSVPGRRGSGLGSSHSKYVLSMASSLAGLEEHIEASSHHSRNSSLEPPAAAYVRGLSRDPATGTIRLIRDHDEDGDGLADLEVLHHRSSRTRMGKFLMSYASDRSLRSTASFNAAVPTWAKVYYGSGERKWLAAQPSMESMYSEFSDSQPPASFLSRTPSQDANVTNIHNPRRRPREPVPRRRSEAGSMDITPAPPAHPVMTVVRNLKKQTSSIWSPHLARDRRPFQHSIWQPPTSDWEARSELTGRRNAQVTMFVVGFIFPLAWMFAACMPLKPVQSEDTERNHSTSKLEVRRNPSGQTIPEEDHVFTSAIWWRKVNRGMSIIGLLMVGAIIALIVTGVRAHWGH